MAFSSLIASNFQQCFLVSQAFSCRPRPPTEAGSTTARITSFRFFSYGYNRNEVYGLFITNHLPCLAVLHGLKHPDLVHERRLGAQLLLEDLIAERTDIPARGRFGQIMFMLPYLQTISGAMIQQIQAAKKDGLEAVDTLISEILLECKQDHANKKENQSSKP